VSHPYGDNDQDQVARPDRSSVWKRGLIMFLLMFCFGIAQSMLYPIAVVQFLWMLIIGERNVILAQFGRSLGLWLAETTSFLCGDTEEKPFPWRPWPQD
jgi:hypothetical protein